MLKVPVLFTRGHAPYNAGERAAFLPAVAHVLIEQGIATSLALHVIGSEELSTLQTPHLIDDESSVETVKADTTILTAEHVLEPIDNNQPAPIEKKVRTRRK